VTEPFAFVNSLNLVEHDPVQNETRHPTAGLPCNVMVKVTLALVVEVLALALNIGTKSNTAIRLIIIVLFAIFKFILVLRTGSERFVKLTLP
jgi:hypothetical protein